MKLGACKICKTPKPRPMTHIDNERWPKNREIIAKLKNRGCVICRKPPISLLNRRYEQAKKIWYDRNYKTIIKLSRALGQSADDVLYFLYDMTMSKFCRAINAQDKNFKSCRVPLTESGNCDLYLSLFDVNGNLRSPLQPKSLKKLLELMQEAFAEKPLENSREEHISLFDVIGGGPKRNRSRCFGSCDPLGLCKRDMTNFYSIDGQHNIDEILAGSGLIDGIGKMTGFDENNGGNEPLGGSLVNKSGLNRRSQFGGEGQEGGQRLGDYGNDWRGQGADGQGGFRGSNDQQGGARGSRGGVGKGADRKGGDGRGGDARDGDAKGGNANGGDGRRGDGKGGEGIGVDGRRGDGKGGDGKGVDGKGFDGKGAVAKGGDGKGLDGKGAVAKGGDGRGKDRKGGDDRDGDAKDGDAKGGDGRKGDGKGVDGKGGDGRRGEPKKGDGKSADGKSEGRKGGRTERDDKYDDSKYNKKTEEIMRAMSSSENFDLPKNRKGSQFGDISDLYSKVAGGHPSKPGFPQYPPRSLKGPADMGKNKPVKPIKKKKYRGTNQRFLGEQIPVLWHEPFDETKPATWIRRHPEQLRITAKGDISKGRIRRYHRETIQMQLAKARQKASVLSTYSIDVSPSIQTFTQFGEPPAKKKSIPVTKKKNN